VETEFKGDALINLEEEISRQSSIQTVTWLLSTTFSHIYTKNHKQEAPQKDLENLQSGQKRRMLKVVSKECMITKIIGVIKKKLLYTGTIGKLP
jgi:hypothetical protein